MRNINEKAYAQNATEIWPVLTLQMYIHSLSKNLLSFPASYVDCEDIKRHTHGHWIVLLMLHVLQFNKHQMETLFKNKVVTGSPVI